MGKRTSFRSRRQQGLRVQVPPRPQKKTAIFFFARGRPSGIREVVCWLNEV